jgi:hypothetical protein
MIELVGSIAFTLSSVFLFLNVLEDKEVAKSIPMSTILCVLVGSFCLSIVALENNLVAMFISQNITFFCWMSTYYRKVC